MTAHHRIPPKVGEAGNGKRVTMIIETIERAPNTEDNEPMTAIPVIDTQDTVSAMETPSKVENENSPKNVARTIDKIHKDLADYHAAGELTSLDLATTEKEVSQVLIKLADRNLENGRRDTNPVLSSSALEGNLVYSGGCVFPPALITLIMATTGSFTGSQIFMAAIFLFALFTGVTAFSLHTDAIHPYTAFRNKVIFRKRFQREVRAITQRNVQNAERNRKLLEGRVKKMERVQQRVKKLSAQYEQHNPGMALGLSSDERAVIEIAKPVKTMRTDTSKKALVEKIAPRAVEA